MSKELDENKNKMAAFNSKKDKLKSEKREWKRQCGQLEDQLEQSEARAQAVSAEILEANQLLRDAKCEIEGQMDIISELKQKLQDAMNTL